MEDEDFKVLMDKSMKIKAEELDPPDLIEDKVRKVIDRELEEHPQWRP